METSITAEQREAARKLKEEIEARQESEKYKGSQRMLAKAMAELTEARASNAVLKAVVEAQTRKLTEKNETTQLAMDAMRKAEKERDEALAREKALRGERDAAFEKIADKLSNATGVPLSPDDSFDEAGEVQGEVPVMNGTESRLTEIRRLLGATTEELRPCPFCGSKAERLVSHRPEGLIACSSETCALDTWMRPAAWNKRSPADGLLRWAADRAEELERASDFMLKERYAYSKTMLDRCQKAEGRIKVLDDECGRQEARAEQAEAALLAMKAERVLMERVVEAALVLDRYRGKAVVDNHAAKVCGCDPSIDFIEPDCGVDRGIIEALTALTALTALDAHRTREAGERNK